MSIDWLWSSPQYLKGIGPKRAAQLRRQGIEDVFDLVNFLPRGYRDFRAVVPLARAVPGVEASFRVEVVDPPFKVPRRRFWRATVADASSTAELFWFTHRLPGPARELERGRDLWIVGKPSGRKLTPSIAHPRIFSDVRRMQVEPLYRGIPWLSSGMRRAVEADAEKFRAADPLPDPLRRRWKVPDWATALREIHAPTDADPLEEIFRAESPGYRRIAADMFYAYFLGMGLRRRALRRVAAPPVVNPAADLERLKVALPFELTGDQRVALREILTDMRDEVPMYRLVQGDVGSGKTVVAAVAAAATAMAGGQAALLAPTEILAAQHTQFFDEVLAGLGIRVARLTGSLNERRKEEIRAYIRSGNVDVVVGTHALLEEAVAFRDLRLVVVDEEQRYGVGQRSRLRAKGAAPHTLLLTATPIPRSLALTLLGETDVSVIREKPAGRAAVTTELVEPDGKRAVLEHIEEELAAGHRVFFLYPRVEEGDGEEGKSVIEMHRRLASYFGADRVGLLHGRMPGEEKDRMLRDLKAGRISILVSTSVIEVGVDVPEATVLVIGHPETFGLTQLHQIRGRIGRGRLPGTCYLLLDEDLPEETVTRLRVLTETTDGFEIAEADLELRGPGSMLGTRQTGLPDIHPALLRRFPELAREVRATADEVLEADPELLAPANRPMREILARKWDFPVGEPLG